VHGVEEDEANHRRVCNEYAFGVVLAWSNRGSKVGGSAKGSGAWKNLRIVSDGGSGVVVEVRPEDPVQYRKKVLQVKGIVDREVGFVVGQGGGGGSERKDATSLHGKTAFLYVEDKRIVGLCTVEVISKAYTLLNAPEEDNVTIVAGGATRTTVKGTTHPHNRTITTTSPTLASNDVERQRHFYRSTQPTKALMGVHQIWCHRLHRRKGIARTLVNMARDKLVYGMTVPFDLVAFSSPTENGAAFARRYLETERPLVYDCR